LVISRDNYELVMIDLVGQPGHLSRR
jgi:hypothetical protein